MGTPRSATAEDLVERLIVVDVPADRHDVFGRSALDQEAALAIVEPEPHHLVGELVDVQADSVGAEAPPVGEPLGLDHDIARTLAELAGDLGIWLVPGSVI